MNALNLIRRQRNYLNNCPNHGICFGIKAIQLTFQRVGNTEVLTNKARLIASICLLAVVSVTSNAEAQKAEPSKMLKPQAVSEPPDPILTKRQQKQIDRIQSFLQSMEPTLMPVLRKSQVFPQMQADMKRIAASKNDGERQKQANEYQRRYREVYGAAWEKAGYKRSSVLEQVRRLAPDMNVRMIQDYGFKITLRQLVEAKPAPTLTPGTPGPAPKVTAAPLRHTEVRPIIHFEVTDDSVLFGVGATGTSIAQQDRVEASLLGLQPIGGVIAAEGAKMHKIIHIPADLHAASLRLRGSRGRVTTFAASIGAVTVAVASAGMIVNRVNPLYSEGDDLYTTEVLKNRRMSISLAPIAWATYHTDNFSLDRQVALQPGKSYIIDIGAGAFIMSIAAIIATSGGTAVIADVNVALTTIR